MTVKTTPWDSAEYLKTEADMADYLAACFEEAPDDPAFLVHALGVVARARNMSQLARDTGFADVVAEAELERAEWTLDKPETPGTYYFRFRSIEPDGFVGPYSSALKIEVPRDWSGAWRVLLPMLLVL